MDGMDAAAIAHDSSDGGSDVDSDDIVGHDSSSGSSNESEFIGCKSKSASGDEAFDDDNTASEGAAQSGYAHGAQDHEQMADENS